jgi:hypothetical protein
MATAPRIYAAFLLPVLLSAVLALPAAAEAVKGDKAELPSASGPGYRFETAGWTFVHLEGDPAQIGFQHGQLLKAEIEDLVHVTQVESLYSTKRAWAFYREAGRKILWPHIDAEYQQELEGIARGAQSRGSKLDVWDIVALNGSVDLTEYYVPWLNKRELAMNAPKILPKGRCSAFIATGSYTKDGKIVIAHTNWSDYAEGARWTVIFDIKPEHGHRILMDGEPGVINSADDFGFNDSGIMTTETGITQFEGFDPSGKSEFVRARKAMQYASSVDEYVSIMKEGNNGGYANDWLIGDRKTGEIAYLELGLKNTPLWRSKDGYFISSNFPRDPQLIKTEAPKFDPNNLSLSENARRVTWEKKMAETKGRIDIGLAEKFLADQYDSYTGKVQADNRSLCGHVEKSADGVPEWDWGPYYPGGSVTGKVADSDLVAKMTLIANAGPPCGGNFLAAPFLAEHPEYSYLKPILKDITSHPWITISAGDKK